MKATYKIEFDLCSEGFRRATVSRLELIGIWPFRSKLWVACTGVRSYRYEEAKKVEMSSEEIIDEAVKRLKEIAKETNKNQEWNRLPDLLFDENGNQI